MPFCIKNVALGRTRREAIMTRSRSGSEDALSSEIAIPVGSLVNELTMTVKFSKSAAGSEVTERREALSNIQPGDVVEIRSDDLGHVTVARARQVSKGKKATLPKSETAILRYLYSAGHRPAWRPQLQAELKWPGGGRLYLLTPNIGLTDIGAMGAFPFSELPTAKCFQVAADGTLDMLAQEGFSDAEVSELVIPKRTLARRQAKKEPLTVDETDKALRLARTAELANKVFGDREKAHRWLRKPKRSLDGDTPLAYLSSETGARVVEDMLLRIESGILA
jgi:putative toxin-antitoxin system antitoxin component (TIGR02293 family)